MSPDPSDVYAVFSRHYFYFAMLATLGTLQVAVSIGGFRGMWLFPSRMLTRFTGIALICAGIALFFLLPLWTDGPWAAGSVEADSATRQWGKADWSDLGAARNVNDIDGGLSGTGQATWFPLSALIAVVVSLTVGTINMRLFSRSDRASASDADGIELLSDSSYISALKQSWQRYHSEFKSNSQELLARADSWSISVQVWKRVRK